MKTFPKYNGLIVGMTVKGNKKSSLNIFQKHFVKIKSGIIFDVLFFILKLKLGIIIQVSNVSNIIFKKKKKPFYGNALAITNFYMYMHVLYIASW